MVTVEERKGGIGMWENIIWKVVVVGVHRERLLLLCCCGFNFGMSKKRQIHTYADMHYLHLYICTTLHTYKHMYIHTYKHASIHPYIHVVDMCIFACVRTWCYVCICLVGYEWKKETLRDLLFLPSVSPSSPTSSLRLSVHSSLPLLSVFFL